MHACSETAMSSANINDRSSVERLYPRDAFERDAGENARGKAPVLKGVRILSAPDAAGSFELTPATQHTGEMDAEGDSVFLVAYVGDESAALHQTTDYGGAEEKGDALKKVQSHGGYESFIDRVLATAEAATFKPPIGRGDERLKGFRGG
jgi:hypothetical protein